MVSRHRAIGQMIHRRGPWRNFEAVEFAALEWVDWFNNRRLLEPIGNIPPGEAEQRYYAMLEQRPWLHNLNQIASGKPGAVHVGKPAVRNDRGDRGNVGIIRSPVRASILPDRRRTASGDPVGWETG
jgi:hypothetical protein